MSDFNKPKPGSIFWSDLTVPDAEKLRAFYETVVGWTFADHDMGLYADYSAHIPGHTQPTAGICHARGANADLPPVWLNYIAVTDLETSVARCRDLGGEIVVPPKPMAGRRFCVVQDPVGAVFALFETDSEVGDATDPEKDRPRREAVRFNNRVWELLANAKRSNEDNSEMIHAAHASHAHWMTAGTAVHHQRGLWLLARVYAELGIGTEAQRYAQQCAAMTQVNTDDLLPFDLVYSQEALARAAAINGNKDEAERLRGAAMDAAKNLSDTETRKLVIGDIESGNWGSLRSRD